MNTLRLTTIGTPVGRRRRIIRLQLLLAAMDATEQVGSFRGEPLTPHERERLRFARRSTFNEMDAIRSAAQ